MLATIPSQESGPRVVRASLGPGPPAVEMIAAKRAIQRGQGTDAAEPEGEGFVRSSILSSNGVGDYGLLWLLLCCVGLKGSAGFETGGLRVEG